MMLLGVSEAALVMALEYCNPFLMSLSSCCSWLLLLIAWLGSCWALDRLCSSPGVCVWHGATISAHTRIPIITLLILLPSRLGFGLCPLVLLAEPMVAEACGFLSFFPVATTNPAIRVVHAMLSRVPFGFFLGGPGRV